jgi:hypothetical protein
MIQRLEGPIFQSEHDAEKHGLELGKKWIDRNPDKKD